MIDFILCCNECKSFIFWHLIFVTKNNYLQEFINIIIMNTI